MENVSAKVKQLGVERNAEVSFRNFILNHQRHFSFSQFIMDIMINFHKKSPCWPVLQTALEMSCVASE